MARTKGSKSVQQRDVVTVEPSRCKKCNSTRRAEYKTKQVHNQGGIGPDGLPYTRIVRRLTKCLNCGQARTDRTYEYDPPAAPKS